MLLGRSTFGKIKEKEMEKKINNDLAIVASQIPRGAIHDSFCKLKKEKGKRKEKNIKY